MGVIASQITSLTIVFSTFYSDAEHQSSASLSFVRGIHRVPVNSPHKWQVTRKMFPFDDVIMNAQKQSSMRCMVSCLSTHWGIVVQISVSKLGHQWLRQTSKPMMTYHHLPLSATACEISICILYFSFKEMYLKMFACNRSGLGILTHPSPVTHKCIAGLGISSATWHCRKNCSRWQHSFNWMYELRLRFHWSLFLRFQLTIIQHWFRWWLGAVQATSHYLIQWWLVYWRICITRPQWDNTISHRYYTQTASCSIL